MSAWAETRSCRPHDSEENTVSAALGQPWRNLLLSLHIAASVATLDVDLVLSILGAAGLAGVAPLTVYPAASLVGTWLAAPLALATLATGLALAFVTPWRLFAHRWVTIKLAIVLALTSALLFLLLPALAVTAAAVGYPGAALPAAAVRLPLAVAQAAASVLLVVAILLAVFKPGSKPVPRSA
jgi:hypothetical protein